MTLVTAEFDDGVEVSSPAMVFRTCEDDFPVLYVFKTSESMVQVKDWRLIKPS